jgi:hypothetical protein
MNSTFPEEVILIGQVDSEKSKTSALQAYHGRSIAKKHLRYIIDVL